MSEAATGSGRAGGQGGGQGDDTSPGSSPRPRLRLHVREGCHLCEDMADGLAELFAPDAFDLELVDIDADPALKARYDVDVPVLVGDGTELCRHFLDPVAVTEHLAGYTSAPGSG